MEMHTKKGAKKNNRKTRQDFENYDRLFHADLKDTEGLGSEPDTFVFSKEWELKKQIAFSL